MPEDNMVYASKGCMKQSKALAKDLQRVPSAQRYTTCLLYIASDLASMI